MAKTDRNVEIMRDVAGTTSLITDYGETPSLQTEDVQISILIKALRETSNVDYEKLVESYTSQLENETDSNKVYEFAVDFGFKCGEIELAKALLPILENLQKQH
jgi:hypothetical protein